MMVSTLVYACLAWPPILKWCPPEPEYSMIGHSWAALIARDMCLRCSRDPWVLLMRVFAITYIQRQQCSPCSQQSGVSVGQSVDRSTRLALMMHMYGKAIKNVPLLPFIVRPQHAHTWRVGIPAGCIALQLNGNPAQSPS